MTQDMVATVSAEPRPLPVQWVCTDVTSPEHAPHSWTEAKHQSTRLSSAVETVKLKKGKRLSV